jgi:hypothetical protein
MRAHTNVLFVGLMLTAWGSTAAAGDIFVICHSSISLQSDEIRDVYLGDKAFADTVKLAPADNSAAQETFLAKVMKLDAKKYSGVWIKKTFRDGSVPPPVKATDVEAIAYVKQTAGGCSYVTSAPGDGVVMVAKF